MIGMEHIGITEEQLNALGKAWTKKAGEVRWYVNGWQALIGMEVQYHRSGNVADVYWTVDGERTNPSNSWYSKYVASTKVWLDAQGRVHVDRCESRCVEEAIVAALDRIVERMVAPAGETSIEAVPEEAVECMVAWAVPEEAVEEEAGAEYWLDVESDGADSFGLFAGAVSTLGPYASETEARARAEAYGGRWKVWSRVAADGSVVTEVCAQAEAQAPVEEEDLEDGWSEELADERAEAPRMVVRNAAGESATIRRVLEQEDLERYGAEELAEAPKDAMWGVQWDQSAVFGWLREGLEQAAEIMPVCLRREDGEVARVEAYALESDEDLWQPLERTYPQACDLIDERAVLPSDGRYDWSESFGPREGGALAQWLAQGVQHYSGGLDGSDAIIEADRREGIATVTWAVDGLELSQDIDLGEGDFEKLVLGADPVAEGWEDGLGRAVCAENASGDVPEGMWADVMATASWEPWDQGDSCDEQVQYGAWRGRRVEAVYRIPDPEAFEEALREDEDAAYLDALVSVCFVPEAE